jgi:hypothetical protein
MLGQVSLPPAPGIECPVGNSDGCGKMAPTGGLAPAGRLGFSRKRVHAPMFNQQATRGKPC